MICFRIKYIIKWICVVNYLFTVRCIRKCFIQDVKGAEKHVLVVVICLIYKNFKYVKFMTKNQGFLMKAVDDDIGALYL